MFERASALRQRLATEHCKLDPDPGLIADLRREHVVARIEDFAAEVLTAAPPLRDDQRQHLAEVMLKGGADAAA